jgi:hypothetical protein
VHVGGTSHFKWVKNLPHKALTFCLIFCIP